MLCKKLLLFSHTISTDKRTMTLASFPSQISRRDFSPVKDFFVYTCCQFLSLPHLWGVSESVIQGIPQLVLHQVLLVKVKGNRHSQSFKHIPKYWCPVT